MEKDVLKFEQEILRNPKDSSAYAGLAVSYIFSGAMVFYREKIQYPKLKGLHYRLFK